MGKGGRKRAVHARESRGRRKEKKKKKKEKGRKLAPASASSTSKWDRKEERKKEREPHRASLYAGGKRKKGTGGSSILNHRRGKGRGKGSTSCGQAPILLTVKEERKKKEGQREGSKRGDGRRYRIMPRREGGKNRDYSIG